MKKALIYIVIALTLLAIPVTVFLVGQQQELRKKAAPASTLSFSPANKSMKVGETVTLEAMLDTADNQVAAVQVNVVFDPTKLEAVSITNGSFAPSVYTAGKTGSGTASITVGAANAAAPLHGQGSVAILKLKALTATSPTVSVRFGADTFAGALNESTNNVIVGTTPATITITNADGTTPSITPTATPSVTPSVTPTGTLTPTLTPTPPATPSGLPADTTLIQSPAHNANVPEVPTFQGKTTPGATVTITIYSTPQTVVVTADSTGNWSYTPNQPLEAGPHNLVVSAQSAGGQTETASTAFVVSGTTTEASDSAIPVSGNVETTILILGLGVLLLTSGILLPAFVR